MMRACATALALLALNGCGAAPDPSAGPAEGTRYDTEIRWTRYGIPHVRANDWGSLGYGFAYATARDAVCVIARELVTVNGESSRHFGVGRGVDHAASDVFHRALLTRERAEAFVAAQGERASAYDQGYVAGYNRYLRDHAGNLPSECADAGWVKPMDIADLAKLSIAINVGPGLGRYLQEITAAAPPGDSRATSPGSSSPAAVDSHAGPWGNSPSGSAAPGGSNAVALGRAATTSGGGMLFANPHNPWSGPSRFHLIHLSLPGEVDVMGASLLTANRVGIGFNRDVAWAHTVSTAARTTLYRLELDPKNPLRYRYGEDYRSMRRVPIDLPGPTASGSQHTVYLTHYGPVVESRQLPWNHATAFAVRDVNLDNHRSPETYDALSQAASVDEVEAAISRHGVAWSNTLAADRHGTAFYADISATPNVDAGMLAECQLWPEGLPDDVVVLDGASPACEWRSDPRSAVAGAMPAEAMPRLRRDDYVLNANDSYWLVHPDQLLEGFPPIIGDERTARSLRTRAGFTFLAEHLADGPVSPEDLQGMLYSHRNYTAELLRADVLALCSEDMDPVMVAGRPRDAFQACRALSRWDGRMTTASRGGHVWREFWREAQAVEDLFVVPFTVTDPVNTPRGVSGADEPLRQALVRALARAQARLEDHGIPMTAALGEIQYVERDGERLPVPGGYSRAGMWSVAEAPLTEAGYTPIRRGNSYIQVVSWDSTGKVDARGILTYSQSPDPGSPHHADLTRLYADGDWLRLPFEEADIRADPELVSLRLSE